MFCKSCGKEIREDALICDGCGREVKLEDAPAATGGKSKIAAGLFALFLGCYGVHNFYLGYKGRAIAQLLITVVGSFVLAFLTVWMLGMGAFLAPMVTGLWSLIEAILIFCGKIRDAKGNPLN